MRTYLFLGAVFLIFAAQGVHNAYGWTGFAKLNILYAVGEIDGKSYLYTIDPVTGEFQIIGDTGLNNCRGLDFSPEGKLKAYCELREEDYDMVQRFTDGVPGVVAELNLDDGAGEWAVTHGISNNISDITITDDGTHYSHENAEQETLYKHVEENDFAAMPIGQTGVETLDLAMASWGLDVLKIAANDGAPKLFSVNPVSGAVLSTEELEFPEGLVTAAKSQSQRVVLLEQIQFGSMDSIKAAVRPEELGVQTKAASGYAFAEGDAEFAAYLFQGGAVMGEADSVDFELPWAAIALIDADTLRVDYIVELGGGPAELTAIAVRPIGPRPIPSMSEWGLIVMASVLGVIGILVIRKMKYGES